MITSFVGGSNSRSLAALQPNSTHPGLTTQPSPPPQFRVTVSTAAEKGAAPDGQVFLLLTGKSPGPDGKPLQAGAELDRSRLKPGSEATFFFEAPGFPGWKPPEPPGGAPGGRSAMGELQGVTLVIRQGLSSLGTWRAERLLLVDAANGRDYSFEVPGWFGAASLAKSWDAEGGSKGLVPVAAL